MHLLGDSGDDRDVARGEGGDWTAGWEAVSMALDTSEGSYSRGRNAQARFHTALGSARETLACVEVGVALGYLPETRAELMQRLGHIMGTLKKLTH